MITLYQIIGVPPSATQEEIKQAYWAKARKLHPDTGTGDVAKFTRLANAWNTLEHAKSRKMYDARLKLAMQECRCCKGDGVCYTRRNVKVSCDKCDGRGYLERQQEGRRNHRGR